MTSRELALAVVRDVFPREGRGRGAHESFDYRARRSGLDDRDRAFAAELAYGAIKGRRFLDWVLAPYVGDRGGKLPPTILEILRLGAYQLRAMHVEPRAAVSESVGLAKRFGHRGTAGLVNAVLRRVAEAPERVPRREDFRTGDEFRAVAFSFPTWIVTTLREVFGEERLEPILAGMNAPPQTALRIDLLRGTVAQAIEALAERGIAAEPSRLVAEIVIARRHGAAFADDPRWLQQGEIAAVPVDLLDPQPGERIAELCSGRGNKTLQIVSRIGDRGSVEAIENDARRASQERERLAAAQISSVRVVEADAGTPPGDAERAADRVLLDAPCSGLGILGRQPEARWRKEPGDPAYFAEIQARLLGAAARRVRPGGRLVYSVCSVDPREGVDRVEALLAVEPGFRRLSPLPERYAEELTPGGDVLVPPGIEGRDGFFIAVLERAPG